MITISGGKLVPVPSSLPWMESVDAKFARALEHFQTCNIEELQFVRSVSHNIVHKHNPTNGAQWLVLWDSDQMPPLRLSVIIGDVLFNLRSALDHLICGLARKEHAATDCRTLQFPICTSAEKFEEAIARKQLLGVPAEAIRQIRAVQPFWEPENSRLLHPLWLLNSLNNQDKHRSVHITIGASQSGEFALLNASGIELHRARLPPPTGYGPTVIDLPASLPEVVRVQAHGEFVIAFRTDDVLKDRPVHGVLAACIRFVDVNVIAKMKPFFKVAH